ncbi:MAG: DUF4255 domain-containing protein [Gemmatimonadales bacterium]|nr:MAG: DUF4255 domain-containing protein [Gemmatimonadales bacterium]
MIADLDATIEALLEEAAEPGSELALSRITFDVPDPGWRASLESLTVNCYLYQVRENRELRTMQPLVQRSEDGMRAVRRRPPARIECAYCITTWSPATEDAVLEEHRLLGQVLMVLLRNPAIPTSALRGSLTGQLPPFPTIIAVPDGAGQQPDFWSALDLQLKPSLNYAVTLAAMLDEEPDLDAAPHVVTEVAVTPHHLEELP